MSSSIQQDTAKYWGYLIKDDKSPSPLLERLLLSIANFVIRNIDPSNVDCLTPEKLARFYSLAGGNYEDLFLRTPHASISFIYRSIGCYHTLQPNVDPYGPPTIPALTPSGFVRWQTLQLLLDPDEHAPFLQQALRRFDLVDLASGKRFPRDLPRTALPLSPDVEMTTWHASMAQRLLREAQTSQGRTPLQSAPKSTMGNLDESSRPTSADSLFSVDSQSLIDAASYFQRPKATNLLPRSIPSIFRRAFQAPLQASHLRPEDHLLRRSNSYPEPRHAKSPRAQPHPGHENIQFSINQRPKGALRTPSSVSTSSCSSDCSSCSTSSASLNSEPLRSNFTQRSRADTNPVKTGTFPTHRHARWSTLGVPMTQNTAQSSQAYLSRNLDSLDMSPQTRSNPRNFRTYIPSFGINRTESVGDRPRSIMRTKSYGANQPQHPKRRWL